MAIVAVMTLYGLLKFQIMLQKDDPIVTSYAKAGAFSSEDRLDMKEARFRFAWAFEGSWDKELKNDPRFVKTYARAAGKRDGKL